VSPDVFQWCKDEMRAMTPLVSRYVPTETGVRLATVEEMEGELSGPVLLSLDGHPMLQDSDLPERTVVYVIEEGR
jgi:hypothetical protein